GGLDDLPARPRPLDRVAEARAGGDDQLAVQPRRPALSGLLRVPGIRAAETETASPAPFAQPRRPAARAGTRHGRSRRGTRPPRACDFAPAAVHRDLRAAVA